MKATLELTKVDLEKLVRKAFSEIFPEIDPEHISIETKSKQNYKAECEIADFRATVSYNKDLNT